MKNFLLQPVNNADNCIFFAKEQNAAVVKRVVNYSDYLESPHWQRIRREALKRAKHQCALCPSRQHLQVHHRTYARFGHENPEDVIVLCDGCHEHHHKRGKLARAGGPSRELVALVQRQMAEAP